MAMIFQDPLSAMHPYYTVGAQIVEAYRLHNDVGKKAARKRAVELLDRVGIPQPDRPVRRLPAPVLRRHAAAGDDRDGAVVQPGPADRRRADHRAGRHRAGADPRPDRGPAEGVRLRGHHHHPRPRRGRRAGRRHPRDVRRAGGGVRHGARRLRAAPAPVHVGAARLDAADRPGALRPAPADPRQPAEPDQRAVGLRVPPAVCLRGPHGRPGAHRAAGAARGGAGPPGGLPSSGRGAPEDLRRGDRARSCDRAADVLLSAERLQMHFPVRRGLLRRKVGAVQAVDGLDVRRAPGRDAVAGRRVGVRQDHHRVGCSPGCWSRPTAR